MPTIHEQMREVAKGLDAVSSEAACEARLILAHVYGTTPGALIMRLLHESGHEGFKDGDTAKQIVLSVRLSSATTRLVLSGSRPRSTHSTLA